MNKQTTNISSNKSKLRIYFTNPYTYITSCSSCCLLLILFCIILWIEYGQYMGFGACFNKDYVFSVNP